MINLRGLIVLALLALFALVIRTACATDTEGQYAQSPNREWVRSLHSPAGSWCCDISDGHALVDADWRSQGGRYQVRLSDAWIDVPDDAVIPEPNRIGQTVVWFVHQNGKPVVTCFLAGALS